MHPNAVALLEQNAEAQLNQFYRSSQEYGSMLSSQPTSAYDVYLNFIQRYVQKGALLLEVGCGTGTAAKMAADIGYRVVGSDLSPLLVALGRQTVAKVQVPRSLSEGGEVGGSWLRLLSSDTTRLPFADASIDAVTSFQHVEHVPDARGALYEMARVLVPGGILIVVGPNLLSPVHSYIALSMALRRRPGFGWLHVDPKLPKLPFGRTLPQIFYYLIRNLFLFARQLSPVAQQFPQRAPDTREPAGADSDSVTLLNPVDVSKALKELSFQIIGYQTEGKTAFLGRFGPGTWVAARKLV